MSVNCVCVLYGAMTNRKYCAISLRCTDGNTVSTVCYVAASNIIFTIIFIIFTIIYLYHHTIEDIILAPKSMNGSIVRNTSHTGAK